MEYELNWGKSLLILTPVENTAIAFKYKDE